MLTHHHLSFFVKKNWGDYRFKVLQLLSPNEWFPIQNLVSHPWQYFIRSCWQEKVGILTNGWTHPSSMTIFVHLFIWSVIQKVTLVRLNTVGHSTYYLVLLAHTILTPPNSPLHFIFHTRIYGQRAYIWNPVLYLSIHLPFTIGGKCTSMSLESRWEKLLKHTSHHPTCLFQCFVFRKKSSCHLVYLVHYTRYCI